MSILAVCLILVISVSSILYARRRLVRPSVTDLELSDLKKVVFPPYALKVAGSHYVLGRLRRALPCGIGIC